MGDVAILLHADDLQEHIPEDTHRIFISAIKQSLDASSIFIRSTVKKRWPTQKTRNGSLIKVVLADGEHDTDAINCFFVSELADQSSIIAVGDTILLSKFYVENCTNPASSGHSCQLLLDRRRCKPVIVIIHDQPQQQQPPAQQQPSTSHSNTSPKASTSTSSQKVQSSPKRSPKKSIVVAPTASTSVAHGSGSNAPAVQTAIQGQGPKVTANYTYTKLKDLARDALVNVYGIVKFVKQPCRTKGTDYMMLISIVDSSLDSLSHKLKCVLFGRELNALPGLAEVGDIIRMHRLKINEFNGELQGKNGPACTYLLFDNGTSASLTPKFKSTNHYTITEEDYNKVTELRTWWSSLELQDPDEETPLPRGVRLLDVQCGSYFDLTCQVIAVCPMTPGEGCLLKVWDGTKVPIPVHEVDTGDHEVKWDTRLAQKVAEFIVDVCVFDNHFERGSYCQPGNYIKLYNLHAMKHKTTSEEQHSAVPTVELCLHGGTSYGRGMRIFDEADQQIQSVKKRLEDVKKTLPDSQEPSRPTSPQANQRTPQRITRSSLAASKTPLGETTNQELRRSPRIQEKSSPQKTSRKRTLEVSPSTSAKRRSTENSESGVTPRCMVNTATVILGHRHIPQSSIKDVQHHSVPYKFRVQARLMDYQPKVGTARDLLKLYCPKCHYLSPLPESKAALQDPNSWAAKCSADTVENGIPIFRCPKCIASRQKSSGPPMLKYIYMFQLIIYDERDWLVTQLMKDDAVTFFDTPAEEMIRKRQTFQWLQAQLRELCPSRARDKTRPLMELCIKSYSTPNIATATSYQIFDTSLALLQDSI